MRSGAPLLTIERAPFVIGLAEAHAMLAQDEARVEQARRGATSQPPHIRACFLLAAPFALTGALLLVRRMENDIYFQIGLVVLIGLAAKNAILIAEFSMQGMVAGKSAAQAVRDAARLAVSADRDDVACFRRGSAAGHRCVGGMLLATFIAPVFVPLFFALLTRNPTSQSFKAYGRRLAGRCEIEPRRLLPPA